MIVLCMLWRWLPQTPFSIEENAIGVVGHGADAQKGDCRLDYLHVAFLGLRRFTFCNLAMHLLIMFDLTRRNLRRQKRHAY